MDVYMHRGRARSERYASPSPLCPHAAYPERERECVTVSLCVREARERSTPCPRVVHYMYIRGARVVRTFVCARVAPWYLPVQPRRLFDGRFGRVHPLSRRVCVYLFIPA